MTILGILGGIAVGVVSLLGAGYIGLKIVEHKMRRNGIDMNLLEMARVNENNLAATPKSLSGMTSVLLPRISRDFPDFNWSEIRAKLEEEITGLLKDEGARDIYIHRTVIAKYEKVENSSLITTQTALKYRKDKKGPSGEDMDIQARYVAELVYMQDLDPYDNDDRVGIHTCPNCGGAIRNNKMKYCEFCGCGFTELNVRAWGISGIKEG